VCVFISWRETWGGRGDATVMSPEGLLGKGSGRTNIVLLCIIRKENILIKCSPYHQLLRYNVCNINTAYTPRHI